METTKNFFTRYSNIFYSILSAILIVSWAIFSSYIYIFVLDLPKTLILNGAHLYLTLLPCFAIYYFLGEYRIYKYWCIIKYNDVSILDELFLKK